MSEQISDNTTIENLTDAISGGGAGKTETSNTDKGEEISKTESNSSQSNWLQSLPEDLRGLKSLEKFSDTNSLVKSYIELEKSLDKKISLPTDTANDEEWLKLYSKLGMPEDKKYIADDRKAELLKNNLADEDTLSLYEDLFHKGNLTKRQGQKILEHIVQNAQNTNKSVSEAREKDRASNMTKFNEQHGEKVAEKLNILKATMAKHGSDELVGLIEESNYAPVLIDLLLKVGESNKEDMLISGKADQLINDKNSATKEIKRLESDAKFMLEYRDKKHVGHSAAIVKMNELYATAYNK